MRALPRSMARSSKSRNCRANPTKVMAGRTSAGQLPRFSSAWPSSSSRMTASCSAPVMRRISSSEIVRSSEGQGMHRAHHRCLRRVIPCCASSRRRIEPDSFDVETTKIPEGSAPERSLFKTTSTSRLETPEPAVPVTRHLPVSGSGKSQERELRWEVRGLDGLEGKAARRRLRGR